MALDEPQEDDEQLTVNDVPVLLSRRESDQLLAAVIDYHQEPHRQGFSISNGLDDCC